MQHFLFKTILIASLVFVSPAMAQEPSKEVKEAFKNTGVEKILPKSDFILPEFSGFQNIYGKNPIITDAVAYNNKEPKVIQGFYLATDLAHTVIKSVAGRSTKDPLKIKKMRRILNAVTPRFFFYESRFNGHVAINIENFGKIKEKIKSKELALVKKNKVKKTGIVPIEEMASEGDDYITTVGVIGKGKTAIVICTTTFHFKDRVYYTTAIRKHMEKDSQKKVIKDTQSFISAFKKRNG